jgi:hypothetical protein
MKDIDSASAKIASQWRQNTSRTASRISPIPASPNARTLLGFISPSANPGKMAQTSCGITVAPSHNRFQTDLRQVGRLSGISTLPQVSFSDVIANSVPNILLGLRVSVKHIQISPKKRHEMPVLRPEKHHGLIFSDLAFQVLKALMVASGVQHD